MSNGAENHELVSKRSGKRLTGVNDPGNDDLVSKLTGKLKLVSWGRQIGRYRSDLSNSLDKK